MDPDSTVVLFRTLPQQHRLSAAEKNTLKDFALDLSMQVAHGRPFTCLITTDREMQNLNREFLRKDYPTDVLSFPSEDGRLGELAISIERAEEQASGLGHNRIEELRILMLHGILHLLGFDHETDRGKMAREERKWRSVLQLAPTLIARSEMLAGGRR